MKRRLFTRFLSIALAITILSSDLSAYAASDVTETTTEVTEEPAEKTEELEEIETGKETEQEQTESVEESELVEDAASEEDSGPEETEDSEESVEPDADQKEIIEVQMEDVYYLVSEVETSATAIGMYNLSDGQVSLKSSNETAWIDRLDLTDAADIRNFYDSLVEVSDNDGTDDYLIDDSYLDGDYNLTVAEITEKVDVEISNAADESVVKSEVEAAVNACAKEIVENYNPYIIAARDAFDRDHPEVFWLSGETAIGYSLGYQYSAPETTATTLSVEYTVTLSMVLKGTVNGESFDIRATGYQSQPAIEDGIADVDSACEEILSEVSELSNYEKLRYFNDILTKSNEYNTSDDLDDIGNDCRECVSALEGRTGTDGPVCEGYARAMKVLCDKAEIPCVLVSGMAKNSLDGTGEAHMWNYVQLDGKWYGVDVTWNDPTGGTGAVSGYENEDWLLLGSNTVVSEMSFETSHPVENVVSTGGVAFTNGPVLNEEQYIIDSEEEEETSGFTYELLEDGTASISAYVGDIPSELEIPSEIDGYTVTAIGEDAFRDCTEIASVILPESITAIGFCAFYGCTNMTTINIPKNVTNIENAAFRQCKSLKEVKLPEEMENLGSFAFGECTALEQINIPEGITAMQNGVLWECDSLTSIILPESIKTIDYHAFSDCDNLKEVTIPSGVTSLDEFAFFNCISLEKIELPTTVENIGDYAFSKGDLDEKVYENLDITIYVEKKDYVYQWAVDNGFKVVLPESEDTKTGIYEIDGKFYIYRDDNLVTGYIEYEGQKYYANANGVLQTGWIKVGNVWRYFDATGDFCEISYESADGYLYILENGDISYFSNKTTLVKNTWLTISGYRYYFDENGFAVKGWYQDGSYWYYADENGRMAAGVATVGEKKYYFDSAYHLSSGWKKIDGVFRYFNVDENHEKCYEISMDGTTGWVNLEDGRRTYIDASSGALTGWRTLQGYRYHFNSDGFVDTGLFQDGRYYYYGETEETATDTSPIGNVVKGVKTIDGKIYGFHTSSYYRLTGWQTLDGERYYFQDDCSAVTGWYQEGNYCYYADENGRMAKGEKVIGEYTYYFDSNYRLTTGWQTINGQRYYLDANGLRVTGEFQVGNYWYYADTNGVVAKGLTVVDGTTYLFHSSQYYRLTGWQTVNGQRYFFNEADGKAVTGWYQEGDYWYYADANGCMAKGLTTIGDKQYYFDNSYHLSTGWKKINNQMYFFDSVAEEPEKCCAIAYDGEIGGWLILKDGRRSYVNAKYQVLTGWQTINGQRYCFDSTGIMKTGLFQDGRYYYYAEPEGELIGTLAKGVKIIDGKVYGFHSSSYYRLTGWQTFDGQRYYFQDDCSAVIGWYWDGTYWYYADANGCMVKGAQKIGEHTYYFDNNYRLTTGWVKIDNVWRYFDSAANYTECFEITYEGYDGTANNWAVLSNGKKSYINTKSGILKGWQTIDGQRYYFDNAGIMQTGWFQVGNYWYYAEQDGAAAKGIKVIDGETYLFHTSAYYRLTGWQTMDGKRFYLGTDGKAQTGWIENGGRKYYAEPKNDGDIIKGTVVTGAKKIEDSIYVFHPSQYYLLTGWQTVNGQRYYIKEDGKTVTGWYQEGDYWYYADENGCMAKALTTIGEKQYYFDSNYRLSTGWKKINNQMYFFDWVAEEPEKCCSIAYDGEVGSWFILSDGRRSYINAKYQVLTGWQTISGQRYYFDSTGIMKTGLFQDGRYYYYAEPEGEAIGTMAKGAKIIDGKVYGFHTNSYYRLTGWQTLDGERYYFKDDCTAMIGWYQEGNYWYYADENGCMAKGIKVINGENYYFDNNYRLTTGWYKIDNQWRFFNSDTNPEECCELSANGFDGTVSDWVVLGNGKRSYYHIKNGFLKGWQTIDGQRYYFDNTGILQTGWFQVGNYWYYGAPVVKGAQVIEGKVYGFHSSQYYRLSGWQTFDGNRYYFQEDGSAVTGWYQEGDYWYYADENGRMAKDLTIIGEKQYYFDGNYRLATGWKRIGNKMYFFNDVAENPTACCAVSYEGAVGDWITLGDGRKSYINAKYQVLTGWQTINGQRYYFDSTGIMETGLFQVGRYYYYAEPKETATAECPEGSIAKGVKLIDGKIYGFHTSQYYRLTGWQTLNGERYYFQDDCTAVVGWYQEGSYWYYADANGCMVKGAQKIGEHTYYFDNNYHLTTGWIKIDNQWRYFTSADSYADSFELTYTGYDGTVSNWAIISNGKKSYIHIKNGILKGWQTIDGQRYYFDSTGIMQTGEFQVGNYWYYADQDGAVAKGIKVIDGETYLFHTSAYYRLTGWQTMDGKRFYLGTDGKAQTGWIDNGGRRYYAEPKNDGSIIKGTVVTGAKTIDGIIYVFHPSQYYLLTGWQTVNNQRYYIKEDGSAVTGWYQEGDYWYYADENGCMQKGLTTIGEKQYYFDGNYRLSTGWKRINNDMYFFDDVAENPAACCAVSYDGAVGGWIVLKDDRKSYINAKYQVLTGWQTINSQRYYFDSTGIMETGLFQSGRYYYYAEESGENQGAIAKGVKAIDGKIYGFHTSQYYRLTGWQTLNGQRYYFKDDCSAAIGWYYDGSYWYYADENGCMLKNVQTIGGKNYYFDGNYRLTTGWIKVNNQWRFFNNAESNLNCYELAFTGYTGTANDWAVLSDGRRSYIHTRYGILKGWQTINGQRYYFDSIGIMQTGEFKVGNYWYYADADGAVAKGFKEVSGKMYYFHPSQYYRLTGWQTVGGQRYYFDADGMMQTAWFEVSGYWYYADQDGKVQKGLINLTVDEQERSYYLDGNYRLQTGWITISGIKYHFAGAENPQDCYAIYSGNPAKGWFVFEGRTSYFNNSGVAVTGWQTINSKRYYFNASGVMQTGWFKVGDYWYYANSDGTTVNGLIELLVGEEKKIYYFDESYRLQTGWQTINGKKYYFVGADHPKNYDVVYVGSIKEGWQTIESGQIFYADSNGNVKTGWQTIDGQRYYFDATGALAVGWFKVGNYWYYGEEKTAEGQEQTISVGAVAKGIKVIAGDTYCFHTSGYYMLTGWQTVNGQRFYLDTDGSAKNGWFTVSGKTYYAETVTHDGIYKGTVAKGAKTIGTETYFFHSSQYYMLTGFQYDAGKRYYLQSDGTAKTGWFTVGTDLYYGEPSATADGTLKGTLASGAKQIDGATYFFHTSANYRLTGWQTVNGERYYLDADGTARTGWFTVSGKIYYGEPSTTTDGILKGTLGKGAKEINGKTYVFHTSQYYRLTGWQTVNGERYYLDVDGTARIGWFGTGGYYYYAYSDGTLAKGLVELPYGESGEKKTYYFDTNYRLKTGWQTVSGVKYLFQNLDSPAECYATDTVTAAETGWLELENGQISYANSRGVILTGWQTIDSQRYYFDSNGALQIDWFKVGNYWYYGEEKAAGGQEQAIPVGAVAKGIKVIDGETYCFHTSSYYMLTGWQTVNGQRFYLESNGKAKTDWFTLSGKTYYAETTTHDGIYKGTVAKGAKSIGTETYFFHSSQYYMLTGFQSNNGNRYYLQSDGTAKTGWFTVGTDLYYGEPFATADGTLKGTLASGAKQISGETYFFHTSANYRLTGWQTVNGDRYYLDADGTARTGWFTISGKIYYGEPATTEAGVLKGTLAKGAKEINGETYVFHPSAYYRLTSWQTVNGQRYYLDANGKAKTGWFTIGGKTYYASPKVVSGAKEIDGQTYVFHSSQYYMLTGFQSYGGKRYYLQSNGTAKTGWFTVGTDLYYGEPAVNGELLKGTLASGAKEIGGETYFFHTSSNYRLTGWQTVNGERYYLDADGTAKTGWFVISGKIYYGEPSTTTDGILKGTLGKGAKEINGKTYIFHTSQYYRLTGWQTVNNQRYYLNADGTAKTGWFETGGYCYYANSDGTLVKGLAELPYGESGEKKTYYFDTNYRLKTGWQTINGVKYLFRPADSPAECYATDTVTAAQTGWLKLENGQISYADSRGVILTGWQTIDNQRYYFDGNGALQIDWFKVGNYWYYGEEKAAEGQEQTIPVGAVAKGIREIDGAIYCFHPSGYYMLTGWQTVNGQRFYLESDGKAKTDWFTLSGKTYYAETATHDGIYKGTVARGAKTIGTETYFFHSSQYYMLTGFQSYNGSRYYLQSDGTAKTGWFTVGTDLYYGEPAASGQLLKGTLASGAKEISGKTYFFHTSSNYRLTGWQTANGDRYYLDADGTARTGWFTVSGKIYYGEPTTTKAGVLKGTLAKGAKEINGATYVFHTSSYYRLTGWQTVGGQRYYLNTDGKAKTGWFKVGNYHYYGEPVAADGILKGTVAKGLKTIGTETYYFHPSGYYMLTGWQTINKERYYFNTNGVMEIGWFQVGSDWYYAKEDGIVVKGLVELPYGEDKELKTYYFDNNYRLKTGWYTINSKKYFFTNASAPEECYATFEGSVSYGWMTMENGQICYADSRGNVKTGWQTITGQRYYFDANGVLQTGWFTVGTNTYYGEPKAAAGKEQAIPVGAVARGTKEIDGETYVFHASGYQRLTGFQSYDGKRYYLQSNGKARTGWFTVGTDLYYGEPATTSDGTLKGTLTSGAKEIDGETYFFHTSSNYRLTGWQTANGQRYYLDSDGTARTGWFMISGRNYYGEPFTTEAGTLKGTLAKGAKEIDGETYVFSTNDFYRLTGWQTVNGQRYYLESSGKAKTDWFKLAGYWYYGEPSTTEEGVLKGTLAKYLKVISVGVGEEATERTYYFDSNYRLSTGWKVINKIRYFFNTDDDPKECYLVFSGTTSTGWFTFEDGRKSYFDSKGNLLTGWQTISGKKYYFDSNGIMQTGWCTINGVDYFFNLEGIYVPITTPTFSSITSTFYRTVDVKWNLIDGVQSYTLEYSKDSIFPSWETTSIQITDTTISEYRVEALDPDTTYYFRIKYTAWGGDELNPEVVYSRYSAVKSVVVRGEVAATSTSATLSECEIISGSRDEGMTVHLKASLQDRIKSTDGNYYIVETESYGSSIDWAEPVGELEKDFEIDTEFVIDQGDGSDDVRECVDRALMNKFALAIKKDDGTYQVISTPMGITNPEAVSENTEAIFTPISKKGLQGVGFDDAADTNSKNTLFNLDLASVVGTGPADGYVAYEYKGKTYYFSECENLVWEFEQMQKGFDQYVQGETDDKTKICVTLNLLLSYKSSNSYLIDPAARSAGHRYYTLNVREEKARETFEAVFLYLGELFGKSDCFVTHWVLGNEVNSSKAWNYQGSLSQDAYMQVYASAFRLLYNGVKAAKTGNNVYISLDNGWTAAPDTYSGKSILDKFAAYAQKENEDMLWSIAYHGYSYPLTRTDFWNDSSNTTFSISTRYISMKNISVLTDYAAALEEKYDKPEGSIRVILSEQGYTASAGQQSQAYALARGYYMAEFNDRVDAFIIRALQDDPDEIKGGLYLGLRTRYEEKRASFYTYEYMDSSIEVFGSKEATSISTGNATKVEIAQDIICNTNWESIIPGFSRSKLAGMY